MKFLFFCGERDAHAPCRTFVVVHKGLDVGGKSF